MINAEHLRREIVAPALRAIGMWSEAAENLLLGTAAVESRMGTYLRQLGGGPARGIWQVEPFTHDDLWRTWLRYRPEIAQKLLGLVPPLYLTGDPIAPVDAEALACPLYCCAVARLKYRRAPAPLPAAGDWAGLEAYHKAHYNTVRGKTRHGEFIAASREAGLID